MTSASDHALPALAAVEQPDDDGRAAAAAAAADLAYEREERLGIQHDHLTLVVPGYVPSGPTADDPLRGLTRLARVALVGRDRIVAKAAEPIRYVWQDIAVAGTIVVLAGRPAGGKTTLLFLLLCARAQLGPPLRLLHRAVVSAAAGKYVVLIEGEHGECSAARKLVQSCRLLGIDDGALDRMIVIARKAVTIGSPEWLDVERQVALGLVSDIGLDTLARVAPGEANDEGEQVAIFDRLARTIELAPTAADMPTIWCAAHTKKEAASSLDAVSGSTQRVGQADTVLLVDPERDAGGRVVAATVRCAKLREDPDDWPAPVTFAIQRDECGDRRLVVDDVEFRDEARTTTASDGGSLYDRVKTLLRTAGATGWMILTEIATRVKASGGAVGKVLRRLVQERVVEVVQAKRRGCHRAEYRWRASTG